MENLTDIISTIFGIVIIVLSIFVAVHASMQIKVAQIMLTSDKEPEKKKEIFKLVNIVIIAVVLFSFMYFKTIKTFSTYKTTNVEFEHYQTAVSDLNDILNIEFSVYGDSNYTTAEDLAILIYNKLLIKDLYNIYFEDGEINTFSKKEISKYKLEDFKDKPTLTTYDGMLMSIIKFKEGCQYVNPKLIGKSDCIIEVDVNHYAEPNQIGRDRTLFAIDGIHNIVRTDSNFFKK
ncbi:hypothetical protein IJD44_06720 [bacterium]|nr:hypothetical protein [bacterium]